MNTRNGDASACLLASIDDLLNQLATRKFEDLKESPDKEKGQNQSSYRHLSEERRAMVEQ